MRVLFLERRGRRGLPRLARESPRSPTSGVILLALSYELNITVKQVLRTATKVYHALVRHAPKGTAGTWNDILSKDVYNGCHQKGKKVKAKVTFRVMKRPIGGFPVSLLKLNPVTAEPIN